MIITFISFNYIAYSTNIKSSAIALYYLPLALRNIFTSCLIQNCCLLCLVCIVYTSETYDYGQSNKQGLNFSH